MKKFTLVLLSLLTLLPLGAWAEVGTTRIIGGVVYVYDTSNSTALVNMVDPSVSSAEIPAEITVQIGGEDQVFKVTSFLNNALKSCSSLKSLTIGENIGSIPTGLFKDCSALQTLTIKKTSMLSGLNINFTQSALNAELCIISGGLRYYHHGAWNASGNYFSVGDGSRGYGYDAVTRDGDELAVLEKVCNIPVTTIADNAFYGTASDCSISIPKSITTISSLSFVANKLKSFSVASGNAKYKAIDGVLFTNEEYYMTLISFPAQKGNSYDVPGLVGAIGAEAFNNHVNLTNVTIPSTVKTIGQSAFQYAGKNTNLSVTLEGGQLTTIERSAFQESGVTAISLPSGVTTISPSAFYNCASLQLVTLPSSLTSIGDAAFAQCKNLVTLNFPNTLGSNLTIGANAFYECKLRTSITLPEKVTTIGSNAFNCSNSFRSSSFQLVNLYLPRTATFSSAITNSFVNVYRKVDIAFEDNYATYFSTMDLDVQSGLKAYTITGVDVDGTALTLTQLPYIPKGKAVLLEKEGGATLSEYYRMPSNATIESGNNITYNTDLFRGSYNPTKLDNISGDKYILSGGKFVKILQGTLPAFRCYLVVNNAEIDAPADYYTFNKDDGNSYVYKEEGAYIKKNVKIGSASLSAPANNKVTLTVTPKTGFYATESDITVTRNVKAVAGRAPSIDNSTIALTPTVADADPSGTTTYTFAHVANTTYEVIVNFRKQNNFSDNNIARDIVFDATEFVYDGTEKRPTGIAVKYNNNVVNSKNYTISYTNNVNAGSATITVTGKREFVNTYSKTFNIAQRAMSGVSISEITNKTFTGEAIEPAVEVSEKVTISGEEVNLIQPEDYEIVYSDNIHPGTAKVTVKSKKRNYIDASLSKEFIIAAKELNNESVVFTPIPDQKRDGNNEIKPDVEIRFGDVILKSGTDYNLAYTDNTTTGTAKVTATFCGDYSGSAFTNFKIVESISQRALNVSFEGENRWATYFWDEYLAKPDGLRVFAISGHDGTTLTLQELTTMIPKDVPVLLYRTGDTRTGFVANTMPAETTLETGITPVTDLFFGSKSSISDISTYPGTKFVLVNDQFVQTTGGTLPANRCYLNFGSEELAGINTITIKTGVGPDDFIYLVDGSESNVGGSAVKSAISEGKITLTVTPNTEYFVEASDIKVTRSVSAVNGRAQAVDAPKAKSGDVTVTAVITEEDPDPDPNGVTYYTFPADANSKYQVVINFHKRLSFADNKPSITFKSGNLVYNGQEQKPEIDNVTFKGQTLRSEDYEIVGYEDNIYPGGSKIFIRGKRKYTGQNQGEFNISQRDLKNVAVAAIPDQIYTGVPIVPEITVTDIVNGIDILNRKEGFPDYKVTIGNNTNVGTATVSIDVPQNKINYTGNKSGITFKILPKDLSLEENKPTIAAIADQAYDGTEKTPKLEIKDGTRALLLGTDYEVSYANNIDAGIATASITFKGNYTGAAEKTFGIVDPGYDRNVTVNFDSKNEWTTYYSAENLTLTNELKAYVVTGMNAKTVNVKEVNFIPRNVPILLNRVSGDKTEFAVKTCSGERLDVAIESQIDNELFNGTAEDMDITTVRGIKFVLINGEFKQVVEGTLKQQRCYLVVPELPEGVTSLAINKASDAVIYLEEGSETTANIGTAVASKPANGIVTLTVRPKVGYYINGVEDITVVRNANAGKARAQQVDDGKVMVTAGSISDNADYSTTYWFTYPYETDCQYQLTVNFHKSVKLQTERPKISVKAGTYVYDGTAKKPELSSVTLTDGTQLKPGTDFLVVGYEDNINAGTGKVKINGIRKYTDEYTGGEFSISQRDINLVKVKAIADQIYTGAALKPFVEVTDIVKINNTDEDILNNVPGKPDYEVEYLENINVGEAKVNIIAKSVNYTGIKTGATFKIVPKDLSVEANKPTIAAIADQYYTGLPVEPALDIKDGALQLEAGKDYTVKYSNNVVEGKGTAKADITFIGNYKGTAQATFSIVFKEEEKTLNISFADGESWTTYYSPIDVKEVPGVTIFVVTGNKNKTGLDLITEEIKFIPRNVPLLLQHTDASVTTFTGKTMPSSTKLEGVTPDLDLFRGTASDLDLSTVDGVKFILQNDKFVQAIEGTLTANHCYVHLNAEEATDLNIVDDKMAEIIIEEEGKESPRSGTVTVSSSADANGYKTITVKPTEKLYATKDEITVLRYLAAGGATSRRAPGVDNTPVEVEALSAQADPSGETKYRFKYDSNYKYQIVVNFKSRVNLSDPKVSNPVVTLKAADIQNLEYDGQEKKPAVESVKCNGKVVDPANYTISYQNNVDAGKPRVIITGKRFLMGATHAEFTIGKRDFSTVTVEPIGDQEYTGSPIEPAFVIKDMVGTQNILKSTDYTVTYKNNIEVGTATISFLPKNNYRGAGKDYTFNIVPATAINMIPVDEQEGQWFSLTGQPLQNKPTQKGVYILRNKNKKTIKVRIK